MKAIKIVVAVVLAYAALNSLLTLSSTEKGAGFAGVILAFILLISISIYLFYSAIKSDNSKNKNT